MTIRITGIAIALALAFVVGRMTIESQPRLATKPEQQLVSIREPVRDTLPTEPLEAERQLPSFERTLSALSTALDSTPVRDNEASRLHALWQLWVLAADSGVPPEALDALESIRDASLLDTQVQREADRALEDLERLLETWEPDENSRTWQTDPFDLEFAARKVPRSESDQQADATLFHRFALELEDREPIVRLDAVRGLARHRREEVAPILLRAVHDTDIGVRLESVRTLWYLTADGFDRDGEILRNLEYASRDRDERVRTLAEQALVDLNAFATSGRRGYDSNREWE